MTFPNEPSRFPYYAWGKKTVALVGNGPVTEAADDIDNSDIVIRCNHYKLDNVHKGMKVTLHALNASIFDQVEYDSDRPIIACVRTDRMHKVKWQTIPEGHPVLMIPPEWLEGLAGRMKARPTIGCMLLHWLLECMEPKRIKLAGFSWSNDGMAKVHDMKEERALFDASTAGRKVIIL